MDNQVVVHCPGCGASFVIVVEILTVRQGHTSILYEFKNQRVPHECERRQ